MQFCPQCGQPLNDQGVCPAGHWAPGAQPPPPPSPMPSPQPAPYPPTAVPGAAAPGSAPQGPGPAPSAQPGPYPPTSAPGPAAPGSAPQGAGPAPTAQPGPYPPTSAPGAAAPGSAPQGPGPALPAQAGPYPPFAGAGADPAYARPGYPSPQPPSASPQAAYQYQQQGYGQGYPPGAYPGAAPAYGAPPAPAGPSVWTDFAAQFKAVFSKRIGDASQLAGDSPRPVFAVTGGAFVLALTLYFLAGFVKMEVGAGALVKLFFGMAVVGAAIFYGTSAMMAVLCSVLKAPAPFKSIQNAVGAVLLPAATALAGCFVLTLILPIGVGSTLCSPVIGIAVAPVAILLFLELQRRLGDGRKPVWPFVIAAVVTGAVIGLLAVVVLLLTGFSVLSDVFGGLGGLGGNNYYF